MREKLIKILEDFSTPIMLLDTKLMDWNIPTKELREAIADHLIANGVTIPVRCKDCKHYMTIHCTCDGCCISDDWYCADGERKTDG